MEYNIYSLAMTYGLASIILKETELADGCIMVVKGLLIKNDMENILSVGDATKVIHMDVKW